VGTEYAAHTDAQGRYRLAEVPPGEYTMGFSTADETLFEGTLEAPVVSVREGATVHVDLGVPSAHTLLSRLCPVEGGAPVSDRVPPAVALGFVRDAETGEPVAGARVWFLSSEFAMRERSVSERWERRGVVTDESGAYRACGLPGNRRVVAQAETGEAASDTVWARTPRGGLLRLDMAVTRGKRAAGRIGLGGQRVAGRREKLEPPTDEKRAEPAGGTSTLLGVVRSAETGRPLEGARVSLPGLGVADVTDGHGRYRLPKLPAGRVRLAADYLGFSSDTVVVELKPAGGAYVTLALQTEPIPLPGLEVEVARPLSPRLVGFYDRMHKGLGNFITKEDLERRDVVSNFRRIPNVRVDQCINPANGLRAGRCWNVQIARGYGLNPSNQCKPVVYLDGHLLTFFN
ncbi:MAG: carboxypeptidase regulatory-like domain-containing protein, partial [Gemmatimonadota bacterium]